MAHLMVAARANRRALARSKLSLIAQGGAK
jgi:hypothetical protein